MKMQWEIVKKRGNHRPVLKYSIELEPFERELAVPQVVLDNAVSRPPSSWRSHCYPGQDERAGAPMEWHRLATPSHKAGKVEESLTLAWREPGNAFMDVRAAFERLRHDFECALRAAHDSAPLELVERLDLTDATREHIVNSVAKAKILAAVGF